MTKEVRMQLKMQLDELEKPSRPHVEETPNVREACPCWSVVYILTTDCHGWFSLTLEFFWNAVSASMFALSLEEVVFTVV